MTFILYLALASSSIVVKEYKTLSACKLDKIAVLNYANEIYPKEEFKAYCKERK